MIFRFDLEFVTDDEMDPPRGVIHEALESIRHIEVEAATYEMAEHYVDRVRLALEAASN